MKAVIVRMRKTPSFDKNKQEDLNKLLIQHTAIANTRLEYAHEARGVFQGRNSIPLVTS